MVYWFWLFTFIKIKLTKKLKVCSYCKLLGANEHSLANPNKEYS